MFGLGFGEILVLSAIGLIVLGPKQMPQVARMLGRTIGELRKAIRDITSSVAVNINEDIRGDKNKNPSGPAKSDGNVMSPDQKPFVVKEQAAHPPRPDDPLINLLMPDEEKKDPSKKDSS